MGIGVRIKTLLLLPTLLKCRLSDAFALVGTIVGLAPGRSILFSIFLTMLLTAPIFMITPLDDTKILFTSSTENRPRDEEIVHNELWLRPNGPQAIERITAFCVRGPQPLTEAFVEHSLKIRQALLSMRTSVGFAFEDVCVRDERMKMSPIDEDETPTLKDGYICREPGMLPFYRYNSSNEGEKDFDVSNTEIVTNPMTGQPIDVSRYITKDGDDVLFRSMLSLDGGSRPKEDLISWEKDALDVMREYSESLAGTPYRVNYEVAESLNLELEKSLNQDMHLVAVSIGLSMAYVYSCFRSRFRRWNKGVVTLCSFVAILMALMSTFGFMSLLGVYASSPVKFVPFLMIGIGLDDMFVLMQVWRTANREWSVDHKCSFVFRHAGIGVLFTSVTDFLAFGIGIFCIFPGISHFCSYSACGILMCFIHHLFFFMPMLVLDEERSLRNKGACNCGPCCRSLMGNISPVEENPSKPQDGNLTMRASCWDSVVTKYWARLLEFPFNVIILLLYGGFLIVMGWGTSKVEAGFDVVDMCPKDSYWLEYHKDLQIFATYGPPVAVVAMGKDTAQELMERPDGIDWEKKEDRQKFRDLFRDLSEDSCVVKRYFFLDKLPDDFSDDGEFASNLKTWLEGPGLPYREDIIFSPDNSKVIAARGWAIMKQLDRLGGGKVGPQCMIFFNDAIDKYKGKLASLAYYKHFIYFLTDTLVFEVVTTNVGAAAIAVFVIASFLMGSLKMTIISGLTVMSILFGTVGSMEIILDRRLETISMVVLTLSVGFSIDSIAHLCLAYEESVVDSHTAEKAEKKNEVTGNSPNKDRNKGDNAECVRSVFSKRRTSAEIIQLAMLTTKDRTLKLPEWQCATAKVEEIHLLPPHKQRIWFCVDMFRRVGAPVIQGCVSTLIAILPLLVAKSQIFQTFFRLLFTVIFLSLLHSIFVLPIILSLIGRTDANPDQIRIYNKLNLSIWGFLKAGHRQGEEGRGEKSGAALEKVTPSKEKDNGNRNNDKVDDDDLMSASRVTPLGGGENPKE